MIREFLPKDTTLVMKIWFETISKAHDFVKQEYWESLYTGFKNNYILNSKTFVCEKNGGVVGFISIIEEGNIIALFVENEFQDLGIGKELLNYAKENYDQLSISIFEKNILARKFILNQGFVHQYNQTDNNTNEIEYFYTWEKRKNEL